MSRVGRVLRWSALLPAAIAAGGLVEWLVSLIGHAILAVIFGEPVPGVVTLVTEVVAWSSFGTFFVLAGSLVAPKDSRRRAGSIALSALVLFAVVMSVGNVVVLGSWSMVGFWAVAAFSGWWAYWPMSLDAPSAEQDELRFACPEPGCDNVSEFGADELSREGKSFLAQMQVIGIPVEDASPTWCARHAELVPMEPADRASRAMWNRFLSGQLS